MKVSWFRTLLSVLLLPWMAQADLLSPYEIVKYAPGPGFEKYEFKKCPVMGAVPKDLDFHFFYSDPSNSKIDPAKKKEFDERQRVLQGYVKEVARAANSFLYGKNQEGALCAANLIAHWAKGDALLGKMSSDAADRRGQMQSRFVRKWITGELANAYLKVRKSPKIPSSEREEILGWFRKLAPEIKEDYEGPRALKNNHAVWAGVSILTSAIVLNDRTLYEWGIQKYKEGVDQIQDDGTLPLELDRKVEALHYHHWVLTPLSIIARFAEANGADLWNYREQRIDRLEKLLIPTLDNPDVFAKVNGLKPALDLVGSDQG